jgi:hypothetical protein
VLVLTISKTWFRDLYNFPKRSIHDAPPPPPAQTVSETLSISDDPVKTTDNVSRSVEEKKEKEGIAEEEEEEEKEEKESLPTLPQPPVADMMNQINPPSLPSATTTSSGNSSNGRVKVPLISVIIPTRGDKLASLKEAVSSIFRQEGLLEEEEEEEGVLFDPLGQGDLFQWSDEEFNQKRRQAKSEHEFLSSQIFFQVEVVICIDGAGAGDNMEEEGRNDSSTPHIFSDGRVKIIHHLPASLGKPGLVRNTAINASKGEWVNLPSSSLPLFLSLCLLYILKRNLKDL